MNHLVCDNESAVSMRHTIFVVDDEPSVRYALTRAFELEYRVIEAASVTEARERLSASVPDVILLDYNLAGEDGMSLLRDIASDSNAPSVIMITAHGSERLAVEAMKAGAYDYLAKPYELDELRLVVSRAVERQELRREIHGLRERLAGEGQFGPMLGASKVMRELFKTAERMAQTDLPVMLLGESGTGKDLLSQQIHACSPRAKHRFVAVNCAALPETLVESELFGAERGAYTGAVTTRTGKFEAADRGTLFLDEIGDMDLATQAKILRACESGTVERLGGSNAIKVDVRLISATNKALQTEIQNGLFRQDLYFRLAGATLYVPALRERAEDIPLLLERFWSNLQQKYTRTGPELTREALTRLMEMPWPGNVRQLRNSAEKLFVLARAGTVTADDVAGAVDIGPRPASTGHLDAPLALADFREAKRLFEIEYITRKLSENAGNVTRTAQKIGLQRQSLQEKMRELGIRAARGNSV